jgi:hypothetical protein
VRAVGDTSGGGLPAQDTFELDILSATWQRDGYSRYPSVVPSNEEMLVLVVFALEHFQSMEDGQEVRIFELDEYP